MKDLDTWELDPRWDNEPSRNKYVFPVNLSGVVARTQGQGLASGIPDNELYRVGHYYCCKSPLTHRAAFKNAIDFLVLDETPILAMRAGRICELQEHSNVWGDDIAFRGNLNYLTLEHDNGEFTQYCHLTQNSCQTSGIRVGSRVRAGQQIALVGKTGLTDRDHLHVIVFRGFQNDSPFPFKSLVPKWSAS